MSEQQQEFRRTIQLLKNKNVPESALDTFTVGDVFRRTVLDLESEILALDRQRGVVEHVMTGGFGSGKTHMLTYLHSLLSTDADQNVVISRVDLSDLRDPNDLQYLIIKGLQPAQGGNYMTVLQGAFDKMIADYQTEHKIPAKVEGVQALMVVSAGVLGSLHIVPGGSLLKNGLDTLSKTPVVRKFKTSMERNQSTNQLRAQAAEGYEEHVIAFLNLIQRHSFGEDFDEAAKKLSRDGTLSDMVFRVLAQSGCKIIVILIDELEAVASLGSPQDPSPVQRVLTSFRSFRDNFSKAGSAYPSIGLLVMSTDRFFETEIEKYEPALWSRWESKEKRLQPRIPSADLDYLIYQLRSLYAQAGFRLKSLEDGSVGKLREMIEAELLSAGRVVNMREVISRIMLYIEDRWLRN